MQKYKQAALLIAILTLVLSGGVCYGVKAYDAKINGLTSKQGEIYDTFENNDYENWKKIVGSKSGLDKIINQDDFNSFTQARELARVGQYTKAILVGTKLEDKLTKKLLINEA